MTILEQRAVAEQMRDFLTKWGLKHKFVAKVCEIPDTTFSGFVSGRIVLSVKQFERVAEYMNDYEHRNRV